MLTRVPIVTIRSLKYNNLQRKKKKMEKKWQIMLERCRVLKYHDFPLRNSLLDYATDE